MHWLYYCLITILLFSLHDSALKSLSGSINSTLASAIINLSAALVLLVYFAARPDQFRMAWRQVQPDASLLTLLVAGAALGIATLTFMKAFEQGGQLSLAVPVVYAGVIGLCMLAGMTFWEEKLDNRQWIGVLLAITGIFLMSWPKNN